MSKWSKKLATGEPGSTVSVHCTLLALFCRFSIFQNKKLREKFRDPLGGWVGGTHLPGGGTTGAKVVRHRDGAGGSRGLEGRRGREEGKVGRWGR